MAGTLDRVTEAAQAVTLAERVRCQVVEMLIDGNVLAAREHLDFLQDVLDTTYTLVIACGLPED